MEDPFDFGMKKSRAEGDLEVTGVSRSGRVRKKSSKLTDFENLDELDMRVPKIKKEKPEYSGSSTPRITKKEKIIIKEEVHSDEDDVVGSFSVQPEEIFLKAENVSDLELENEETYGHGDTDLGSGSELEDPDDSEGREDPCGFQPIVGEPEESTSHGPSLYMLEKSSKKKLVIKDGKIVGRAKANRKDKGKSRLTAYMLWAKEVRSEVTKHNPDLDFSQTSRKLGELWASVPFHEKYLWKRRAKRLAAESVKQTQQLQKKQQQMHMASMQEAKKLKSPPVRKTASKQSLPSTSSVPSTSTMSSPETPRSSRSLTGVTETFKPVGTTPLDVAAHLRLLGESLTIIGERLTEHEGQIAVSGSISVLLDSLLCALAPLTCLTQQVPQMNCIPQEKLSQMMDNIAYLMPGL